MRITDDDALAQFEALVLSQKPARAPWAPVTDYSFSARSAIECEHPDRIIQAFGKDGPYLDYGCGPHAILVRLLRDRGVWADGIDPALRDEWRCFQPKFDPGQEEFFGRYPVVICREVFEHNTIRDIHRLIQRFKDFSPQFVYVTTRFAQQPAHLLSVDTSDNLDPTHITMLHQTFLRALFVLEGFKRRPDLETLMDWKQLGRVLVYERAT